MDYRRIFEDYYRNFDNEEYWINYKYNHTMRVVEYANIIAKSLNLSDEDLKLVDACALFHDISRFKQYALYHTFEDAITFDHGDEGYNVLKEIGINNETILQCTKNHNKFKVDESLDDKTKLITSIIRDADKIDIMLVIHNEIEDDKLLSIPDEIVTCYQKHEQLKNGMENWNSSLFKILVTCVSPLLLIISGILSLTNLLYTLSIFPP